MTHILILIVTSLAAGCMQIG